jgi:cytochrome c oxidase subunit 2
VSDTTTTPDATGEPDHLTMGADPYEKNWMRLSVVLLLAFFATVTIAGFAMGFQVSGADAEVDPRVVTESGPWANPGVRQIADGEFEAWVIAQTWAFTPREITVPVGAEVKIHVTSPDVQHGFKITDTNVNMQIVPGQVSVLTYTFDEVGEFPYICHEYCGEGHAAMFGVVNVVSESEFEEEVGA